MRDINDEIFDLSTSEKKAVDEICSRFFVDVGALLARADTELTEIYQAASSNQTNDDLPN